MHQARRQAPSQRKHDNILALAPRTRKESRHPPAVRPLRREEPAETKEQDEPSNTMLHHVALASELAFSTLAQTHS